MTEPMNKPKRPAWTGNGWNQVLKTAYTFPKKRLTIFSNVRASSFSGNRFDIMTDDTDHFRFSCHSCDSVADVLRIAFDPDYPRYKGLVTEPRYAMFFYLGCPSCGQTGQRKIYLDLIVRGAFAQTKYKIGEKGGELIIYGNDDAPYKRIKLVEPPEAGVGQK